MPETLKKVVVLGGGTGTFTVLSGLKNYPLDLSAIVSIADDGGSTGILRDELGVLPPGDIRQCLVALSSGDRVLRDLFNYRFTQGGLEGHNFGNIFLSALEKVNNDPLTAIKEANRILNVKGRVIPVSARAADLYAELEDGTVVKGQHAIDKPACERAEIRNCFLSPTSEANPEALQAIHDADVIVMGPGDLYTSIIPILLVHGVTNAIGQSQAKRLLVVNLTSKKGQTQGYKASDFYKVVTKYVWPAVVDTVVVNTAKPSDVIAQKYTEAGDHLIHDDLGTEIDAWRGELISDELANPVPGDRLKRSLLRHDAKKLAEAILKASGMAEYVIQPDLERLTSNV
jgi:uncharacterized cofD-like protein